MSRLSLRFMSLRFALRFAVFKPCKESSPATLLSKA